MSTPTAPTVILPSGATVRAERCPCRDDDGTSGVIHPCRECSDEGYRAIESLTFCAICDGERSDGGYEWGDDWICEGCCVDAPEDFKAAIATGEAVRP